MKFKVLTLLVPLISWAEASQCNSNASSLLHSIRRSVDMALSTQGPSRTTTTLGIESEVLVPEGMSDLQFAQSILQSTRRYYPRARILSPMEHQMLQTMPNPDWISTIDLGNGKKIEIHLDRSLPLGSQQGILSERGREIVSPILENRQERRNFTNILSGLEQDGIRALPNQGGTHVHVGMDRATMDEATRILQTFGLIEQEILQGFSLHPDRATHAAGAELLARRSTSSSIQESVSVAQNIEPSEELNESIVELLTRLPEAFNNFSLNLHALTRHGTLEFKLFNSTLDGQGLELISDFTQRLMIAMRDPSSEYGRRLYNYLFNTPQSEYQFSGIMNTLGLNTDLYGGTLNRLQQEMLNSAGGRANLQQAIAASNAQRETALNSRVSNARVLNAMERIRDLSLFMTLLYGHLGAYEEE